MPEIDNDDDNFMCIARIKMGGAVGSFCITQTCAGLFCLPRAIQDTSGNDQASLIKSLQTNSNARGGD